MQSFDDCLSGFIPANPQQYFFLLSNCFNNPFAYYPFAASYQFQPPKQVLASTTLDLPFPANLSPSESPSTRKDCEKGKKGEKCVQGRKSVTQREEQQQSFNIKINKNEPCIIYKKKNTESNIVNQTFSFLNSDRSKKPLSKILNNSHKAKDYYKIMTKIKQLNKKYINRNYLKRLLAFEPATEFEKAFLKAKPTTLTIQQIKVTLRKLIFNFLRQQVNMTLMTSGKIYKETLPEHFWRKREIMTFLFSERQI